MSPTRSVVRKVVLVGDPAVGKTSIRYRYMGKGFNANYMVTIGADFTIKRIGNNALQIWDLAGQPMYKSVRDGYYKGAQGIILVYDITRPQTFISVASWINEITAKIGKHLPMILVANKTDLRQDGADHVTPHEGQKYANVLADWSNLDVKYIETSAATGQNIETIFDALLTEIDTFLQMQDDS
ncbi:MAG: GTP-binding protein [Candidatus Heimdallarchaeota archaeon]|nr:GTP-binding protein [Candidatus Heimdallarchaeota archaeon]